MKCRTLISISVGVTKKKLNKLNKILAPTPNDTFSGKHIISYHIKIYTFLFLIENKFKTSKKMTVNM